jgi:hypothetical protein
MEVSGQLHAQAALPPGKESLVPIGWDGRLGGSQSSSGRGGEETKFSRTPIVQPLAQSYTDWTITVEPYLYSPKMSSWCDA